MSDTVPGTIIFASLESKGPSFLPMPEAAPGSGVVHINGGAHTPPASLALLVEFRTLIPDVPAGITARAPVEQPVTVSGYTALTQEQPQPDVIAGALQHLP